MTPEGVEIKVESLSELPSLIQATQQYPLTLNTRSLIYDTGPWENENSLVGIETFFQRMLTTPSPHVGTQAAQRLALYLCPDSLWPQPQDNLLWPEVYINNFCEATNCFQLDPTNFCSTRYLTKDQSFLDKAGIFKFRTIAAGETIREPVQTFQELLAFIQRMPSHKAPGFSGIPADSIRKIHSLYSSFLI